MRNALLSRTSYSGYGHIFPVTTTGKLVCIVYTLVGCMLFISFLANVSEIMSRGIKRIYRYTSYQILLNGGRKVLY